HERQADERMYRGRRAEREERVAGSLRSLTLEVRRYEQVRAGALHPQGHLPRLFGDEGLLGERAGVEREVVLEVGEVGPAPGDLRPDLARESVAEPHRVGEIS